MAKLLEKQRAIKLRKLGTSVKQIARQLHVSPSTVSVWCRDLELSPEAAANIISSSNNRSAAGLLAYSQAKHKARQDNTEKNYRIGEKMVKDISKRDLLMVGIGLYWGEGYKNGNREFGFTNSDVGMITFYLHWLQEIFNISNTSLTLRVSINNQHKDRITEVESYWSRRTNIPLSQFTKPSLIKTVSKKQYLNKKDHFGTLRIKVKKGSDYREQVLGAVEALKS